MCQTYFLIFHLWCLSFEIFKDLDFQSHYYMIFPCYLRINTHWLRV